MLVFAAVIAIVLRFGLPWMNTYLAERGVMPGETSPIRFEDLYPMLVAFFALFDGGLLPGAVFGFMLLDEKDDRTLKAMLVTPVPVEHYVGYRVAVPALFGFVIILGMLLLVGQVPLPVWQQILIAAAASPLASITALAFAVFAENKLQGFAYSKLGGIAGWAILIGWFVPEPWQWLIGLFPPFLVSKGYWLAVESSGGWWIALLAGVLLQLVSIGWLVRRFKAVAYR
jgi:fluoroquinolone transport system permease protein